MPLADFPYLFTSLFLCFHSYSCSFVANFLVWFNFEKRLVELDGLAVCNHNFFDSAGFFGFNFVHHLHRLDDTDDRIRIYAVADLGKRRGIRTWSRIECSDDWRWDVNEVIRRYRCCLRSCCGWGCCRCIVNRCGCEWPGRLRWILLSPSAISTSTRSFSSISSTNSLTFFKSVFFSSPIYQSLKKNQISKIKNQNYGNRLTAEAVLRWIPAFAGMTSRLKRD